MVYLEFEIFANVENSIRKSMYKMHEFVLSQELILYFEFQELVKN